MGDVNQLPLIAMKAIADDSNPNTSCRDDGVGKTVLSEFTNPRNELKTINFTFHMTGVVRKKDG